MDACACCNRLVDLCPTKFHGRASSSPQEDATSAVHMDNPMSDGGSLGEESEHAGNEDDKADDEDEA